MHTTNIRSFVQATVGASPLIAAYCALVALELVLKEKVGLKDHDVCSGINKFSISYCVGPLANHKMALVAFSNQLRTDISAVHVNGKDGMPRLAPANSYPYIRYTRMAGDGWAAPECVGHEISTLVKTLGQIRAYLRIHFGCAL